MQSSLASNANLAFADENILKLASRATEPLSKKW